MQRILDNLKKKYQYYDEFFKITAGLLYDIQNPGREDEFEMLVEKRTKVMNAVDLLDAERKRVISGFAPDAQKRIINILTCRETPRTAMEKAIFNVAQENRKLIRKIMTYNKNLNLQVKMYMSKQQVDQNEE